MDNSLSSVINSNANMNQIKEGSTPKSFPEFLRFEDIKKLEKVQISLFVVVEEYYVWWLFHLQCRGFP